MSQSYEDINYSLRPGKNIERKMILEAARELTHFAPMTRYQYVGLGSTFFTDFVLFHRSLGLRRLVSIEEDAHKKARFLFNRPFRCVRILFGTTGTQLPNVDLDRRSIVWLDYDKPLDMEKVADIDHVARSVHSGSLLIVTVNAHPEDVDNRVQELRKRISPQFLPGEIEPAHISGWKLAKLYREIIDGVVRKTLDDRSAGKRARDKLNYRQLFNFHYRDGAQMLTVGGLVYASRENESAASCSWPDVGTDPGTFIRADADAYEIRVPSLTLREMRHLDARLPATAASLAKTLGIPKKHVEKYAELYRYFPAFVEAEL